MSLCLRFSLDGHVQLRVWRDMARDGSRSIAISFGGTKVAIAVVNPRKRRILCRTDRIVWQDHPKWSADAPLESLLDLVASQAHACLEKLGISLVDVSHVGLAWPGPGRYSEGMLQATFVPKCATPQPIHDLLLSALSVRCGSATGHIRVTSSLDANARACGELGMSRGALRQQSRAESGSGIVLNMATGIAGCLVMDGRALSSLDGLGETYGQWGRYLLKDQATGQWSWRPTTDGSVPKHDAAKETRLTLLCGGPALARRFAERQALGCDEAPDIAAAVRSFRSASGRNPSFERAVLEAISRYAYAHSGSARRFVTQAGQDVGHALACLCNSLGLDMTKETFVLTGGVGECFGAAPEASPQPDLLLDAIRSGLGEAPLTIVRSQAGLDAELVGAVA